MARLLKNANREDFTMPKFSVKLEIPSTTTVELIVEADNKAQAEERGHDYLGEGSSFVQEVNEESESSDQEFGERKVVSVNEIK